MLMGELIRKSHNVSLLMYHFVFVSKYRRLVITEEVDSLLKETCIEISKRYELRFLVTTINSSANFLHNLPIFCKYYKIMICFCTLLII